MPLEKLHIRGFQKHADLTVEFDPACTTILGPTDSGKSAIVRALRWLATNRPAGDAFQKRGTAETVVELRVDGKKITRRRGSDNVYKLDKQKFAAMGARVPEPVAELLNISDINFAGQFDAPFWLADSPGEVSRRLNAIVDLGVIDDTLANVAADVRRAGAAVGVSRERLTAARKTRDDLAWVPEFAARLKKLTAMETELENQRRSIAALAAAAGDLESIERRAADAVAGRVAAQNAVTAGADWAAAQKRVDDLRNLIHDVESAEKNRDRADKVAVDAVTEFKTKTKNENCPICRKPMM